MSYRRIPRPSRRHLLSCLSWLTLAIICAMLLAARGGGAATALADEATAEEADSREAADSEELTKGAIVEEAPVDAKKPLGSLPIGEIEGPTIITDVNQYPTGFHEAPMLAEMVEAGDLPPLAERIPSRENLLVIKPVHEIGKYGGTWRRGFTGPADGQSGHRVAAGDRFVFWDAEKFPEVVPNLAKGWEISGDQSQFTLFMRAGVKWSDGKPFTANDVMFWYENMYQNNELAPVRSPYFDVDNGALLEMVDAYTIRFTFPFANSLFLEVLGSSVNVFGGQAIFGSSGMGGYAPAHYLKQFHADFVDPAELDALVAAEGFDNWGNLFKDKNSWERNPDLPVLTPWKTVNPITTDNWVLERNPYYYGVDTAGNQLPYIDRISMTLAADPEVLLLHAINGEYDYQARHISLAYLPVLLENAEAGGYTVSLDPAQHGADGAFMFNQSYAADAEIAQWLKSANFRRALSLGINRDFINEVIFWGSGVPGSAVGAENTPFNPGPEYRELWSTYDPARANTMLDELSLTAKDSQGYRLRTDNGERLVLEIPAVQALRPFAQLAELVKDDWAKIGIFANVVEQEQDLLESRRASNELPIFLWQNDGTDELFLYPHHALPVAANSGTGPAFGAYYASNGEQGIQPPANVQAVLDMFSQGLKATPAERINLGQAIWRTITDEVWTMGTVGQSSAFMGVRVVKSNMGNIPTRQFNNQSAQTPNISRPSTFYFTDSEPGTDRRIFLPLVVTQ